jgi:nucleoside-diphosphate-sugar epimerase
MVADAAGKKIKIRHNLTGPQGVRGRNSENSRTRRVLGWEPSIPLVQGLAVTYKWIAAEMRKPANSEKYRVAELAKSGD